MNQRDDVGFDLSAWESPEAPAGIAGAVIARMAAPALPATAEAVKAARDPSTDARRRTTMIAAVAAGCFAASVGTYAYLRLAGERSAPVAQPTVAPAKTRGVSMTSGVGAGPAEAPAPAPSRPTFHLTPHGDVRIVVGESATIHYAGEPVFVGFDPSTTCKPTRDIDYFYPRKTDYDVGCEGGGSAKGTLTVVKDNGVGSPLSTTSIVSMVMPGAPWPDPLTIAGHVQSGTSLVVDGVDLGTPADGRFKVSLSTSGGKDRVLIRAQHPTQGIHYYAIRPITAVTPTTTAKAPPAPPVASTEPELTRSHISAGIGSVRNAIIGCASKSTLTGTVKIKVVVRPDGKVGSLAATSTYDNAVSGCVLDIVKNVQFPATDQGGSFTYPFVFGTPTTVAGPPTTVASAPDPFGSMHGGGATPLRGCDAEVSKERGLEQTAMGQHAAALFSFEEAIACNSSDAAIRKFAFMASCGSKNAAKAHVYYGQLAPADQSRLIVLCTRNGIDPKAAPLPPCDPAPAKDKGVEEASLGNHASALKQLEVAYACRPDAAVAMLVAIEACQVKDATRARTYYARLAPNQQAKVRALCSNVGITMPAAAVAPSGTGFLQIVSTPTANILVDGKDTGLTTPIGGNALPLAAGKHKVTFVIGNDRFTYPVVVPDGGVATLDKDLQ